MTDLKEIVKRLEELAPKELTIPGFESRVEIGPITETEQSKTTINRVIVATYLSGRVVTKASQDKANLVLVHQPMFRKPIDSVSGVNLTRIRILAKNYISTYVIGSPWIGAKGGLVDTLVETIGLKPANDFLMPGKYADLVPAGRICKTASVMNYSRFGNLLMSKLETDSLQFTGELDDEAERILVCSGAILDSNALIRAKEYDVSAIVTGNLNPEVRFAAYEKGMNVFELGTFVTENPGMKRLRHQLSLEFPSLKIEYAESEPITKTLKPYSDAMA
ncbi:MAG: Nif3-like dinuclear metal center hexameric protein [Candidatus Thorarchaeota archaeon]